MTLKVHKSSDAPMQALCRRRSPHKQQRSSTQRAGADALRGAREMGSATARSFANLHARATLYIRS